jgi:hypothetical protein
MHYMSHAIRKLIFYQQKIIIFKLVSPNELPISIGEQIVDNSLTS